MNTKINKASAIRQYVEANPNAKAPEVAKETGTHLAYVYAIKQQMRSKAKKKAAAASAPSKGQEAIREVISKDQEEIASLRRLVGIKDRVIESLKEDIDRLDILVEHLEGLAIRCAFARQKANGPSV